MTKGAVEIITSVERRRRWSAAEKEQLIAATLEPGASVSAVARAAGMHPSQLYGWRRQLCARSNVAPGFAAVRVTGEPASMALSGAGQIDIEFASGARMRITGAVDGPTVTAVVAALAGGRRR
jgi:transposase